MSTTAPCSPSCSGSADDELDGLRAGVIVSPTGRGRETQHVREEASGDGPVRPVPGDRRRHPPHRTARRVDRTHATRAPRPCAAHRAASTARTSGWPTANGSVHPATTRWPGGTACSRVRCPLTYEDIAPAMYDAKARVAKLDEEGIQAQVLYPNVGGFGNGYFLRLGDAELVLSTACGRTTTSSPTGAAWRRTGSIAITALPFWDVDEAVAELHRCVGDGHRAVNFCNQPRDFGQPPLAHRHWDPIWAAAQEAGRVGELPRRRRVDGHAVRRHRRDGVDDELRQGVDADLPRQHPLRHRADLRRRVPPLPGPEARLGRVGSRAGYPARSRRATGSGATAACSTSTPSTTCCPASTSAGRSTAASGSRRSPRSTAIAPVPRQHPLRDRLPPPDLPAPRAAHARAATARLRHPCARRPGRRCARQGAPRQRRARVVRAR